MAKPLNKDFYNLKEKKVYMDGLSDHAQALLNRIFSLSKSMEESLGKDISCFTREELLDFYSYCNVNSPSVLKNMHSAIIKYMSARKILTSDIYEINSSILKTRINNVAKRAILISREELLKALKRTELEADFNYSDAFLVLAVFEGIEGTGACELLKLNMSDFHKKNKQMYATLCTGREVKISDELYYYALKSSSVSYRIRKNRQSYYKANIYGEPGQILKFQTIRKEDEEKAYISAREQSLIKYFQHELMLADLPIGVIKRKSLKIAGMVDMVKTRSKELKISESDYLEYYMEEIVDQYGGLRLEIRKLIKDYIG